GRLGAQGFLCARHGHIQQLVHDRYPLLATVQPLRMLMMVWVIWLSVWIICALAWKLRCEVIMSTSAEVVSTFDSSTEPDSTLANPELPATPATAVPEALVAAQLALPSCCSPCGLAKFARAICPRLMERPLVNRACTTPVESTLMPVSLPVVKPFWLMAVTPKLSPYCVVLLKLNTMFIWAAPVAGVYAGKVMLPLAGAVSPPELLYVSACGVPTAVPSTYSCVVQAFAAAPLMKYRVAVCAAPSESYTVRDVELL